MLLYLYKDTSQTSYQEGVQATRRMYEATYKYKLLDKVVQDEIRVFIVNNYASKKKQDKHKYNQYKSVSGPDLLVRPYATPLPRRSLTVTRRAEGETEAQPHRHQMVMVNTQEVGRHQRADDLLSGKHRIGLLAGQPTSSQHGPEVMTLVRREGGGLDPVDQGTKLQQPVNHEMSSTFTGFRRQRVHQTAGRRKESRADTKHWSRRGWVQPPPRDRGLR